VHTCARDVEAGRSKFEEVAAGEPVTEESIQSVLALHCAWKEAEAAFQQGVKDLSRRSGRSVKAIAHLIQHARAGHRLAGRPYDDKARGGRFLPRRSSKGQGSCDRIFGLGY